MRAYLEITFKMPDTHQNEPVTIFDGSFARGIEKETRGRRAGPDVVVISTEDRGNIHLFISLSLLLVGAGSTDDIRIQNEINTDSA